VNDPSTSRTPDVYLATMPATLVAKRCALATCIVLFGGFFALVPFARVPLPRIEAFIPIYDSTFALNNLLTAGGLAVGFRRSRLFAVLVLAGGYLFTSLIALPHMVTFPGLLSSTGLLGAGPQTSAWLDAFRHGAFPVFVIYYALLKRRGTASAQSQADVRARVRLAAVGAIAGVTFLTLLATAGQQLLPQIVNDGNYTTTMVAVSVPVLLLSFIALAVLGSRRQHSALDLWMMVVLCAWAFDVTLSTVINTGRFDIGF